MTSLHDDPRLLAFALGELQGTEQQEVTAAVAADPKLQALVEEYHSLAGKLEQELAAEPSPKLNTEQKESIEKQIAVVGTLPRKRRIFRWASIAASLAICAAAALTWRGYQDRTSTNMLTKSPTPSSPSLNNMRNHYEQDTVSPITVNKVDTKQTVPTVPQVVACDISLGGTGSTGSMGVGASGGKVSGFGYRSGGGHKRCIARFGGSAYAVPATPLQVGSHSRLHDNQFYATATRPFSTFSIDVDTASYSMIRQQLGRGYMPHVDSVRIEEMLNYFSYNYPQPKKDVPFSTNVEVAACPWNMKHRLVRIGLKGREIKAEKRPLSNLVFLLDVSASMRSPNKLGYVKSAMTKLVDQLGENDRVAIVVYAGAAGQVLPSTTADKKIVIRDALTKLAAGGSTAGSAGIKLAYNVARKNLIKGGVNRVILCTDGDFNVGVSNTNDLERLIEEQAKNGVFLSILGFGMGNYRDNRMEALSNKGNGNYAYIDTMAEAEKVLVKQINGTLVTIAKDVKIQVNFNKHRVNAYRLIGYVNRKLAKKDFNDDKKDAGEIGAGHTVTALYEVVPVGIEIPAGTETDDDKYSEIPSSDSTEFVNELLTVRLRYKLPDQDKSKLLETPVVDKGKTWSQASGDYKFAAAVASFGMLLRNSKFKGTSNYQAILELGAEGAQKDPHGYRKEFLQLVKKAQTIAKKK
jgi:Ca-activated chloride channel homolog